MSSVARAPISVPCEPDRAGPPDHPAQRAERRGLAGAVGAQKRADPAVIDREADAVQHPEIAVGCMQAGRPPAAAAISRHPPDRPAITSGFFCTSAGVPSAILRPKFSTTTRSEIAHHQSHVMLDQQHGHAAVVADLADQPAQIDATSS